MSSRMSGTISAGVHVSLYVLDCPHCGVLFGITSEYEDRRRKDGANFYCPNGHHMGWSPDNPHRKIERLEAQLTAKQDQLEAATREAEAVRVALLRDRQRFANGVCPCCNRSFENVRRHMETKHPDYDVTRVEQRDRLTFKCSCSRRFETLHGLRIHQGKARGADWATTSSPYWQHLTKV